MMIDGSQDPLAYPGGKYVSVLRVSQIPTGNAINRAVEAAQSGFRDQDIQWDEREALTPVLSFQWGAKFDRYVRHCALLMKQLAFAARDEASRGGATLATVSGGVTHVNIDYLVRLHRADSDVFRYFDKIGVQPGHWPENDVWRTDFVSSQRTRYWRNASPRQYAWSYFKRFDFLAELRYLTRIPDANESFGLSGKLIWITEFGIPTKKLGRANRGLEHLPLFLYERGEQTPGSIKSIVWEDKWDAFLGQVDRAYLMENGVEVFLVHTLREGLQPVMNDDGHSNYAIFERNGIPRMERSTYDRFLRFFESLRQ
jgi:hypothetical protein